MNKQCIIMRGIPGSGKSTWICQYAPLGSYIVSDEYAFIDPDTGEYFPDRSKRKEASDLCYAVFKKLVNQQKEVIILDNANMKRKEYRKYLYYAEKHGYETFQKVMAGRDNTVHSFSHDEAKHMKDNFEHDHKLPHWNI